MPTSVAPQDHISLRPMKVRGEEIKLLLEVPSRIEANVKYFVLPKPGKRSWPWKGFKDGKGFVKSGVLLVSDSKSSKKGVSGQNHVVLTLSECVVEVIKPTVLLFSSEEGRSLKLKFSNSDTCKEWFEVVQKEIKAQKILHDEESRSKVLVNGKFGKGHFGSVFSVQCTRSENKFLALKSMNYDLFNFKRSERIILEEVGALKATKRRGVDILPEFIASFKTKDAFFLLTDAHFGGNLLNLVRSWKKVPEDSARYIIFRLVEGLLALHSLRIAHRDIKLENVMLTAKAEVKLVDFGLSAKFEVSKDNEVEKRFDNVGTPYYQPPEMLRGRGHDLSSDFWQVGCLMFELFSGRPLFYFEDPLDIEIAILSQSEITLPQKWFKKVSPETKDFILSLLVREPSDRLGFERGAIELLEHKCFQDFKNKKVSPPKNLIEYTAKFSKEQSVDKSEDPVSLKKFLSTKERAESEDDLKTIQKNSKSWRGRPRRFSNLSFFSSSGNRLNSKERKAALERLGIDFFRYDHFVECAS